MANLIGILGNGRGLGTGESCIPLVFQYSFLHRSTCPANVHFTAFTGHPVVLSHPSDSSNLEMMQSLVVVGSCEEALILL